MKIEKSVTINWQQKVTNRKNIYNVCLCLSVPIVRCDEKKKYKKGEIYAKITCER